MKKYQICIDEGKCVGCGACTSISKNFKIVNGKSKAKKDIIGEKEFADSKKAEAICPVQAIKIKEI